MCLFMLHVLLIKTGLEKQHVYIAKRAIEIYINPPPPSNPTSLAGFGASLVLNTVLLPGN